MSKHTLSLFVFTALITACGVDDAKPDTSSQSQALYGEPDCWDEWGDPIYFDDYNVVLEGTGDCYYWEDPGGGGGGGGGGGNTCWWPTNYSGSSVRQFGSEDEARTAARAEALANAENACMSSGWTCTPYVQNFNVTDSCVQPTPGVAIWRCSASATVTCAYY